MTTAEVCVYAYYVCLCCCGCGCAFTFALSHVTIPTITAAGIYMYA